MILSMTGFGKAHRELLPSRQVEISIRTVNSKQLEISTRLPAAYKELEPDLLALLQARLLRGRTDLFLSFSEIGDAPTADPTEYSSLDGEKLKHYFRQLTNLATELGIDPGNVSLHDVIAIGDLFPPKTAELPTALSETEKQLILSLASEALEELQGFRQQEGDMLEQGFRQNLEVIKEHLSRVKPLLPERTEGVRQRLTEALQKLGNSPQIDDSRLEQELIYYFEKLDVSEELDRLENHMRYFVEILDQAAGQGVGKKLGFVLQEMGREINTLGSKSNHAEIQRLVVEMKDELEKMKEQVLNVL